MKTWNVSKWAWTLAVAALPLAGGCARETAHAAPVVVTNENPPRFSDAAMTPGEPVPQAASQDLENAPAKLVSTPAQVAPATTLTPSAAEVARLSQSGVDESVMLAFVNNSTTAFNVGSDQIIYLNDIGVPGNVVTAMIQRDQVLNNNYAPQPTAPLQTIAVAPQVEAPPPPPVIAQDAPPPEANVTYTYFRDSLSPYGNWVDVEGYGQCWQPSVVVVNRDWTPYGDRGHWVYSDTGWYWASDYSWGWAPFHYGRWFRHNRIGWCWAPDTVWGPAWVSWRYNSGYCGWAPLPPTACYRPGFGFTYYGRSVGANFAFGLNVDRFTFVAANHFYDPHPYQYRVPHHQVTQIFNHTTIINPVAEDRGNPRFHRGIPPKQITDATHREIKQVRIQETASAPASGRGEERDRNRGTLTVFRPSLPEPSAHIAPTRVGESVKPATPATVIPRIDSGAGMHRGIPRKTTAPEPVKPVLSERVSPARVSPEHRGEAVPIFKGPTIRNTPAVEYNPPRAQRETGKALSPETKREIPTAPLNVRGPAPVITTPMTPAGPNNPLPRRQPATIPSPQMQTPVPQPTQPLRPAQPQIGQETLREGTQRSQPRQEKIIGPTFPIAPAQIHTTPQRPVYPAPSYPAPSYPAPSYPAPSYPAPRTTPASPPMNFGAQRGAFSPAPARPVPERVPAVSAPQPWRVVVPQPAAPRVEAPRAEPRQAPVSQTPRGSVQRSGENTSGDKRQEGNPRNNR